MPGAVKAFTEKLSAKIAEAGANPSDERVQQEIVLYAARIDVDEELSRLVTHVAEFRRVLDKGGACGKRLDFLCQELNREANTLGSKSVANDITRISVELKVLIEQMREQVQNIEYAASQRQSLRASCAPPGAGRPRSSSAARSASQHPAFAFVHHARAAPGERTASTTSSSARKFEKMIAAGDSSSTPTSTATTTAPAALDRGRARGRPRRAARDRLAGRAAGAQALSRTWPGSSSCRPRSGASQPLEIARKGLARGDREAHGERPR
jgi:hypothetical protein